MKIIDLGWHYAMPIMRLSKFTTEIWKNTGPYCRRHKCRPRTLLSDGRTWGSVARGLKRQWGLPNIQFLIILVAISSGPIETRQWPWDAFYAKFCFLRPSDWIYSCSFRKRLRESEWKYLYNISHRNVAMGLVSSGIKLTQGCVCL